MGKMYGFSAILKLRSATSPQMGKIYFVGGKRDCSIRNGKGGWGFVPNARI
jgi:hypothetical protein